MLGALLMFGLHPGPSLFKEAPEVVWGLIASMYIGNILLLVINIGFIPPMVWIMDRISPYIRLVVLILALVGVYSFRNATLDVVIMLTFAVVGIFMKKYEFPTGSGGLGSDPRGPCGDQPAAEPDDFAKRFIDFRHPSDFSRSVDCCTDFFLLPVISKALGRMRSTD